MTERFVIVIVNQRIYFERSLVVEGTTYCIRILAAGFMQSENNETL